MTARQSCLSVTRRPRASGFELAWCPGHLVRQPGRGNGVAILRAVIWRSQTMNSYMAAAIAAAEAGVAEGGIPMGPSPSQRR